MCVQSDTRIILDVCVHINSTMNHVLIIIRCYRHPCRHNVAKIRNET